MIKVVLPAHLRALAGVDRTVEVEVAGRVTQRSIIDALEAKYPMLGGTIRDHVTKKRRPLVRFFACEEDVSHDSEDAELPKEIADGEEPFYIIGAIAGGKSGSSKVEIRMKNQVRNSKSETSLVSYFGFRA